MKNLSFSGTFYAIQKSYETSTDAVKRADAAKDTLKKSEGLRDNALSDLRDVQPGNTRDLEKLKKDLATRPNLTPTANKVREIARDWLSKSVCFPAGESVMLCSSGVWRRSRGFLHSRALRRRSVPS